MTLRLDEPFRWGLPAERQGWGAAPIVAKAATGWEPSYNPYNTPISAINRSPLKVMREAQALYWSNPWIGSAEDAVTRKVAGLPWHLEDDNEDTVDDQETNPVLKGIATLLEKPQAALPEDQRQPGYETWTDMVSVTSRHMGLCGIGYWYLDQVDRFGIPLAILYVNPARLYPHTTPEGRLFGYSLDPKDDQGRGGTPIPRNQIIPFYLKPPDWGSLPKGLVERAALKAGITTMADRHAVDILGTGGRIAGLVSPREGTMTDEQFLQAEKDFRAVNESPDAARRMTLIRGPVDFNKTGADPTELSLLDISKMNRDDIFAIWGVPASQAGVSGGAVGLNSGETRRYEYQILMQGPVHDRVTVIRSSIQIKLLDRWNAANLNPQLELQEPDFDDRSAPYEIAQKATSLPLTNNERRATLDLDPLPDSGPDGEPLGIAILLPSLVSAWGQGPDEKGTPENPFPGAPEPKPEPTVSPLPPQAQLGPGLPLPGPAVAKASPAKGFLSLRKTIETKVIPSMQRTLEGVLAAQKASVVAKIRARGSALAKKPDVWDAPGENARLSKALRPHLTGIAETVTSRAKTLLGEAKADPFSDAVEDELLTRTGARITGINDTTRQSVIDAIRLGFADGLTVDEVADRIESLPAFDAARAELVARTESGYAYNYAAVSSYREYGVERVEVIDGDEDDICAPVHGAIWTLEQANNDPLGHPNCTRDFAPYFGSV